jgi:phasin
MMEMQMAIEGKAARSAKAAAKSAAQTIESGAEAAAAAGRQAADFYGALEVPEFFRSFAEQGFSQARETYSRIRAAAEETTDQLEDGLDLARESFREIQFKAIDAAKSNIDATFDFYRQLLGTRSLADAVQLQTAFAHQRFEALLDYSRDVQSTLTKLSTEAVKPAQSAVERTFNTPASA